MTAARRARSPALVRVAAACLLGNVAVHWLPVLPGLQWCVPAALLALLALRVPALRFAAVAAVAFLYTVYFAGQRLDARLDPSRNGRDFEVAGWVDEFPAADAVRTAFSLRVERAEPGVPDRLRLSWYDPPAPLEPGMTLELTVRLRAPRGLVNPGGFDYERWLMLEGYGATGYVRAGRAVPGDGASLGQRWLRIRSSLAERIAASGLGADARALVTALTLGERSGFDDGHWRVLRRTGTSHLVAISGMHVGLVALGAFWLTRRFCLRLPSPVAARDLEIGALVSAAAALGYTALAGFALPTQRALLMLLVALCVVVSRRRIASFDGLSLALLLVLGFDPLASLTASFWLSFGAVALLLSLASVRVPACLRARRGYLREFSSLQWCMSLGLVPLVVIHFGELSLIAPLANLLAIPWFSFLLVPAALLGLSLHACDVSWPLYDALLGRAADLTWSALAVAAEQPFAATTVAAPSSTAALLGIVAVGCALPWHRMPGRRLAWLGAVPLLFAARDELAPGRLRVTVLDVGHGLAVLLETAQHRALYDAGPLSRTGFDAGDELVVPALARRADRGLDLLIVGHGDSDHAGGAAAVLDAYPAARVLRGPDVDGLDGPVCRSGDAWVWDEVEFSIVHPTERFPALGNDSSCVLRVSTPRHTLLVTGDIERRAEAALEPAALAADLVVVPHHGSATSSSPAFVAAVAPRIAVVSAGHDNRWGFPRPEVRARWESAGARVVVTGESGAVHASLGGETLEVKLERALRPRYWRSETPDLPGDSNYSAL